MVLLVEDLFIVGRASAAKLKKLNINTVGELAHTDVNLLINKLHSHGKLIYEYANGIDNSEIRESNYLEVKGIGNSTTIPYDVETMEEAFKILLSLTESVAMRLRESNSLCSLVVVSVKTNQFAYYSHQKPLKSNTDSTNVIFEGIKEAFKEVWKGEKINPIRFKIEEENKCEVVKIEKIISTDMEKLCGNKMWVFTCSSVIGNVEKVFELKYDVEGCSWLLYKI
jgi:DNA polymerase-4